MKTHNQTTSIQGVKWKHRQQSKGGETATSESLHKISHKLITNPLPQILELYNAVIVDKEMWLLGGHRVSSQHVTRLITIPWDPVGCEETIGAKQVKYQFSTIVEEHISDQVLFGDGTNDVLAVAVDTEEAPIKSRCNQSSEGGA